MSLPNKPGGPPAVACETLITINATKAKIIATWQTIKSTIQKIVNLKLSIKYGLINLADIIGAELIAAIASAANAAAAAALGAASKLAAAFLEKILSLLLEILLSFPTAIFSLVAIPLEKAREASAREKYYLSQANHNISMILVIINKWFKGIGGHRFYQQIKDSLPYVKKALTLCGQMLDELNAASGDDAAPNASFDEGKYNLLRYNLKQAIKITKITSVLDEKAQYSKKIEESNELERRKQMGVINSWYFTEKRTINQQYMKDQLEQQLKIKTWSHAELLEDANRITSTQQAYDTAASLGSSGGNNLTAAIELQKLDVKYHHDIRELEYKKAQKEQIVEQNIAAKTFNEKFTLNNIKASGSQLLSQFASDMQDLTVYLSDFLKNTKSAYAQQLLCQQYSNTTYNIRNKILALIRFLIALLRSVGNSSAALARTGLTLAGTGISLTNNRFDKAISNFDSGTNKSSSALAATLAAGNALLQTADSAMVATITDSLIKLVNSDDVLEAGADDFNKFLVRLELIPDWDGSLKTWAVQPLISTAVSPYVQLIADVATMVTKVPLLSFSAKDDDKKQIKELLNTVSNQFRKLYGHNTIVTDVLTSYTPYETSSGGKLKQILDNAGLLDAFAAAMSLANLVNSLKEMFSGNLEDKKVNDVNCRKFYPSLYKDVTPEQAGQASLEKTNVHLDIFALGVQDSTEKKETQTVTALAAVEGFADVVTKTQGELFDGPYRG